MVCAHEHTSSFGRTRWGGRCWLLTSVECGPLIVNDVNMLARRSASNRRADQQAGHRVVGIERAVLRQRLPGLKAAPAGDDGIALVAIGVRLVGTDDEVFEQPVGGDRGLEFGICMRVGGVLRTFSGARVNRLSGISRMSGSALGAMWFMRISLCMGWGMVGTGAVGTTFRGRPKPDRPRLRLCLRVVLGRPAGRRRQSVQLQSSASAWSLNAASSNRSQWGGAAVLSSA